MKVERITFILGGTMSRNPYFDNLKAVLILLVVLGHTLSEAVNENKWVASIYMFIYLFHMPAFILVSGYFSKVIKTKKDVWKLAKKFLIPYVIFQVIYTLYYTKVYGNKLEMTFLEPRWALWFLISIFCWNLLLYIFPKNRVGLLLAVGVSLVAGYVGSVNETLTFARTFFFFPFFLIGYLLDEPRFTKLKIKRNVVISWLIFISLFVVVYYFGNIAWKEWLYGRIPYSEISQGPLEYGFVNRAIVYLFMVRRNILFFINCTKETIEYY
ncbi:acyltransferase family protein [Bacillus megaterium]|nr:acyltransferase family protein [Priestia megaterium]